MSPHPETMLFFILIFSPSYYTISLPTLMFAILLSSCTSIPLAFVLHPLPPSSTPIVSYRPYAHPPSGLFRALIAVVVSYSYNATYLRSFDHRIKATDC